MTQFTTQAYWYPAAALPVLFITVVVALIINRTVHAKERRGVQNTTSFTVAPATPTTGASDLPQVKRFLGTRLPNLRFRKRNFDVEATTHASPNDNIPRIITRAATEDINV